MGFSHKGFSPVALSVIQEYEKHGWVFAVSKSGHAIGKAPDGVDTVSIARDLSPANRSQQNAEAGLKRWLRARERAEDRSLITLAKPVLDAIEASFHPNRVAVIAGAVALGWEPEVIPNGAVRLARSGARPVVVRKSDRPLTKREWHDLNARIRKGGDPMTVALAARMSQEQWVEYVIEQFSNHDVTLKVAVAPPVDEPSDDLPVVALDPVRRPWRATSGTGKYESKAVIEVAVGDDVTGYECSKCGWEAGDPHSVAAHYRAGHRRGAGREQVNPVTERRSDYHPTQRLIDALTEFLVERWGDGVSPEGIAEAALTWMATRPDLPEPTPREPLTDTQIVERIRHLVGTGPSADEHEAALADLRLAYEALNAAREREADLNIALAEVTADRDRLQSDLDTWLSLAPGQKEG